MLLNENNAQVEFSDEQGRAYAMLPISDSKLIVTNGKSSDKARRKGKDIIFSEFPPSHRVAAKIARGSATTPRRPATKLTEYAATVSEFKKLRYLKELSEDEFRDRVVRPLLLLRGMKDGRDLCGPHEAGKDSIFVSENVLGQLDVYSVQTKRGSLNLGRKATQNIVEATTQLKTALATSVVLLRPIRGRVSVNRAILCASGQINPAAREYIVEQVANPNISFLDADDLIPDIDALMPQLWFDIDANLLPYIRAFKGSIENGSQLFTRGELAAANLKPVVTSEGSFVPLRIYRFVLKGKSRRGRTEQQPEVVDIPITSLLSASANLLLLLGGPGSGKSTALLRMAYLLCEKVESSDAPTPVPVFFRAQELTSPGETLIDAIFTRMREISGRNEAPITSKQLDDGLVTVFVDALDELPDKQIRQAVASRILQFSKSYPKIKIILSSRPYQRIEDVPALSHFTEFSIAPMTYKEGHRILERFQKAGSLPLSKAGEFLRQLQEVHGLELNPLIVTVFAASCELSRRDVPANITELFKKFTEQMLGRWDESKGLASQYQAPLKDFVLTRLGYALHSQRKTTMPIGEVRKFIASELESRGHKANTDQLTDEVLNRSGLFRATSGGVEFRHLMLQEFFAGRGLPQGAAIGPLITDDWWRRAIVFYFGDRPNEGAMLSQLCETLAGVDKRNGLIAAVTLGLALQASYLVETTTKLPIAEWVFKKLALVSQQFDEEVVKTSKRPLDRFVDLVLSGREAVAFSFLKESFSTIRQAVLGGTPGDDKTTSDLQQFWLIIGLIEAGALTEAEKELKSFSPRDRRLFLGLHLGAYLMDLQRVATADERKVAHKICDSLNARILDLREQLIQEFKSELLEIQQGRIKALTAE
jgi:hypothetical protein